MRPSQGTVAAQALYRALKVELEQAGCFRPTPWRTSAYLLLVLITYLTCFAVLLLDPGVAPRISALAALAFTSVHAGFIAHEASHGAIARNRRLAEAIGHVFDTFLIGLCYSYHRHNHRLHHWHCNEEEADPDIQSDLVSLYEGAARRTRGSGRVVGRRQAWLIWILVWLQGFKIKFDALDLLRRDPCATRADQAILVLHVALWFGPPVVLLGFGDALLNYLLVTLLAGPYLGIVLLVNHIGTPTVRPDCDVPFLERQLGGTRNLGASRLDDFVFGGLNNHIEHHLFPSMPTARLRAARPITRAFCRRHGLPYRETSWLGAAREVSLHLHAMSRFVPEGAA